MTSEPKPLSEAPYVDIFDPGFQADPASVIAPLREQTGIARTILGAIVIRRNLLEQMLTDRRLVSGAMQTVKLQGLTDGPQFELFQSSLLVMEGEPHHRVRRLVSRAFTPRAVAPHQPVLRDILRSLLEPVMARGTCEFMTEIADQYPIRVMCHLLGVPGEDHASFAAWNKAVTWLLSLELGTHMDEFQWGSENLDAYVVDLIGQRRAEPQDDLVTALVQAEEEGDRLSDFELRALIGALLFAGFDTTRNQLGLAMALFAEHPDQWALLAEQPDLAPQAVNEVMRVSSAVSIVPRITTEDVELGGYVIPQNTFVTLSMAAANQDPAVYRDPQTFDITMDREQPVTFGGGIHYCLGANLARAELEEAFRQLPVAMPGMALDGEPVYRSPWGGIFGPDHLPIKFRAGVPA